MKLNSKELKDLFLLRKYSKNTQDVIRLIFLQKEKQIDIAKTLGMKPQRIHNIKRQAENDFFEMKNDSYIKFEGRISVDFLKDLMDFKQKCKSFKTRRTKALL